MIVFTILLGIMMALLFVILIVMVMKVNCLIVIYRSVHIIATVIVEQQSLLDAVRSIFNVTSYVYIFYLLAAESTPNTSVPSDSDSSSSSSNDGDHDNQLYAGVIAGGLFVFFIADIIIINIIIIVIKKKKYTRLSQQAVRGVLATPPQTSVVQYTYPSACNPSYYNPTYAQPQITGKGVSQSAPFHHDTEHATVGYTNNPSVGLR